MTKVITVDERGALTLPKSVRDLLGVTRGGQIVVDTDGNGVRLRELARHLEDRRRRRAAR